jgi:carbamoyltransferase
MSQKYYIGVATSFHDPSISILDESGSVVFAESTERYLQNKRAMGCPADPVVWSDKILKQYCDLAAEFHIATTWSKKYINTIRAFNIFSAHNAKHDHGLYKFLYKKLLKSKIPTPNFIWGLNMNLCSNIQSGITIERNLKVNHQNNKITRHIFNHHLSHAGSACFSSPYEDALCLVVDGMGELGSISFFEYRNNRIIQKGLQKGYESLGFFYSLITSLCGFDPIEGEEWKVMGLASYGKLDTGYYNLLTSIYEVKDFNVKFKSNRLHMRNVVQSIRDDLSGKVNAFENKANLAYTAQYLFSEYMIEVLNNLHKRNISKNLIYAGGCALNSSFNGKILENSKFGSLYIPSAPGDDGTSLGAAFLAFNKVNPDRKINSSFISPYLGSTISDTDIELFIHHSGYKNIKHCPGTVHIETAKLLAESKLIGWAQGRAEFGPRALGNRSILADPRPADMKDKINARVKFREEFRPFAPSILAEYGHEYFENYQESPYMERTLVFRKEVIHKVPAVVHIDQTGRLQTVKKEWNSSYYMLIDKFREITGVPLVLNTSFNVMGKPIIHSFGDALLVFLNSGLDVLVVNDYIIYK